MRKAVKKNASGSPDQEKDENQNVQQRKNVSPTEENAKNENAENEEKEKTIRKLLEEEDIDEDDEDSLIREEEEEEERRIKARLAKANRRGSLTYLMEGYTDNHETINSVIAKLYKKADFVLSKAQRGIIFLDGMDKIGLNTSCSDLAKKQVIFRSKNFPSKACFINASSRLLGKFCKFWMEPMWTSPEPGRRIANSSTRLSSFSFASVILRRGAFQAPHTQSPR